MITEKELLILFRTKGIELFKTEYELDNDTDIILDSDNIEEFIKLCTCYDEKCVFYHYIDNTSFKFDFKKLNEFFLDEIYNNINHSVNHITVEDIEHTIQNYSTEIKEYVEKYNMEHQTRITPQFLELYVPHNGIIIGFSLSPDEDATTKIDDNVLIEHIEDFKSRMIKDIVTLSEDRHTKSEQNWLEEKRKKRKRYDTALEKITEELNTSNYICTCTNSKLRHEYAKELTKKYSNEYDIYITIGAVENLVDRTYKSRKL